MVFCDFTGPYMLTLHKFVNEMDTIVYFRCGADTSIKNNDGLTAEEILLKERPDGWEENLHWYNKFKPGTYSPRICTGITS